MADGPGKYDDLCTLVRALAQANAAIVIVVGGSKGNGFSVQAPQEFTDRLPEVLRGLADSIEKEQVLT